MNSDFITDENIDFSSEENLYDKAEDIKNVNFS